MAALSVVFAEPRSSTAKRAILSSARAFAHALRATNVLTAKIRAGSSDRLPTARVITARSGWPLPWTWKSPPDHGTARPYVTGSWSASGADWSLPQRPRGISRSTPMRPPLLFRRKSATARAVPSITDILSKVRISVFGDCRENPRAKLNEEPG